MSRPSVLIAGASLSGPVLAYWLNRAGYRVTIIERAPKLRQGGNGVDIREQAREVVERMSLMGLVRAAAVDEQGLRFVDAHDRLQGRLDLKAARKDDAVGEPEILRTDLAAILYEYTHDDVEYVFGDAIRSIRQDAAGVDVEFERGAPQRFDLVIGADGTHSSTRRLVFGPEQNFVVFKNYYFASAKIETRWGENRWGTLYSMPRKAVLISRPGNRPAKAYFLFHRQSPLTYDYRDVTAQRRLVREAFADAHWAVPELLVEADKDPDFYFDSLSQVVMPNWSAGRVALVGDAAYCASPASGAGALLALVGAYRLAGELAAANGDHAAAFARYEVGMRPLVLEKQRQLFTWLQAPNSHLGIAVRNTLVRSPLAKLMLGLQPPKVAPLPGYTFRVAALA